MLICLPRVGRAALALCLSGVVAACGGSVNDSLPPQGGSDFTLQQVSPATLRVADALTPVPDTLVFALVDAAGTRQRSWQLWRSPVTTGWLNVGFGGSWDRRIVGVTPDSTGLIRIVWLPGDAAEQVLSVFTNHGHRTQVVSRSFTLARRGTPLTADTVVTSGPESVCVQQGGRVACVGPGQLRATLRPLRFTAPVHSISATIVGVCALLTDGNTACWRGLGPDSIVPNDVTHPPFIEFRGSVGRAADGALWKGVLGSDWGSEYGFAQRSWLPIPSDSAIVQLLADENGLVTCGLTASAAVMCSSGRRVTPVFPGLPFTVTPFQLLRDAADSSVVRATTGYTTVDGILEEGNRPVFDRVVLRTPDGSGRRVTITTNSGGAFYATTEPDSSLPGADPQVRSCVPALDAQCGPGRSWRSVSSGGRLARVHIGTVEVGHRVICGVRDMVVCQSYIAGGARQIGPVIATDTIRLAP